MKTRLGTLLGIVGGLALATTAQAVSVTVNVDMGTVNETTALTGYATTGANMDGMLVTAYFASGGSETVLWGDTGAVSGAAVGTGWSLSESGDTFGGEWTLYNASAGNITRLLIDAGKGNTVYDVNYDNGVLGSGASTDFGTTESARGWTFDVVSGSANLSLAATYRDAVTLTGTSPVGDLYRYLDISFNAFDNGERLVYISDTDNILFAGDITPVPEVMTTLLPLGIAVFGLAFASRRCRAK